MRVANHALRGASDEPKRAKLAIKKQENKIMKSLREIKKELKTKGIEVRKLRATLNGAQAYRVISREHNPAAIWTSADRRESYQRGEFA